MVCLQVILQNFRYKISIYNSKLGKKKKKKGAAVNGNKAALHLVS